MVTRLRAGVLVALGCLALPGSGLAQPVDSPNYVATHGLRLGGTGLTIGAFSTVELNDEADLPSVVALDSVNPLLLWEPVDFGRAFAELEVGGLFSWEPSTGAVDSNLDLAIERLYGELSRGDALNVRFGKFQTPVGIWNLVPAEPFTWTATNPVIVDTTFSKHQTGVAVFGSFYPGSATVDYWFYGQPIDPLDPDDDAVDRSVGGRLRVGGARGEWALGASFLSSKLDGEWNHLGGVDAFWSRGPLELQTEIAIIRGDIPGLDLAGGYVQAAYHLGAHVPPLHGLHLVGRYELVDAPDPEPTSHVGNLGLTWIPKPFLNLKLGGQLVDEPSQRVGSGVFASVSLVF